MSIVSEIAQITGEKIGAVDSRVTTVDNRVTALEQASASVIVFTTATAPHTHADGTLGLVTDGSGINGPCIAYYYGTCWIRVQDNVTIATKSGDLSDCAYG